MQILLVQETDWVQRNPVHQHHLMERLSRIGHRVLVVDYDILWHARTEYSLVTQRRRFSRVSRVFKDVGIEVIRPPIVRLPLLCHLSWMFTSLKEVSQLINRFRPDVLIALTLTNAFLLALLAARRGIPMVLCVLEPYHTMSAMKALWPAAQILEALSYRAVDRVVVFNKALVSYVQRLGARPERVCRLPTGVDLERFHPSLNGSAVREAYGLSPDDAVLLFMGWLYEFCGLREIAEAILADEQIPSNVRLLVVGDGDLYDELAARRERLGDRLILTGRQPYEQIPEFVAAADVCLLPSRVNKTTREIVPMKVYEYMASGKAVVATQLPGLLAEFGVNGGIVYGDGPVDVLKKAVALAMKPEERARLGKANRQYVEQYANWDVTTAQLEELLISTIREQAP